jgi:glycosyltransferase involved in cell wall biosynthesis
VKFLIITHVNHTLQEEKYYGYAPYIQEMNLWLNHVDEVVIVAPLAKREVSAIDAPYKHSRLTLRRIPAIQFTSAGKTFVSLFKIPIILWTIFKACRKTDHIHLRCPGNIGLLGCFVQVLFPKKIKTAKYAGNWDPRSKQPWSYKLQKWILKNEFLTKNMKTLVYGYWKESSKNIQPFFTASYLENEKEDIANKTLDKKVSLLFVGSVSANKRPMLSAKVTHQLMQKGYNVALHIYGEGKEKAIIEDYIKRHKLQDYITLYGNQNKELVKEAYKKSHFLVFMSMSEGWPKVVAEAMFWKCLSISTNVSCVPQMLGFGERGSVVEPNVELVVSEIESYVANEEQYQEKVERACQWSRNYTLDKFEEEVLKLLKK